jgi:sugar lactone lactonase YvrE
MRVDRDGNLWASVGRGVEVFDRGGQPVLRIGFPYDVTNLIFGSPGAGDLFVTAGPGVYRVRVAVDGAAWP